MLNTYIPFKTCLSLFSFLFCFIIGQAQIITTYAGNGTSANSGDGGLPVNSTLSSPFGINGDAAGNLYVSDRAGRIRMIDTKTNMISTYPAPDLSGTVNVAFDKSGNMYVADGIASCIRKIDAVTKRKQL